MSLFHIVTIITGLFVSMAQAAVLHLECEPIYLTNNTHLSLKVTGVYPDTKETFPSFILPPNTAQKTFFLETLRSCPGNTNKVHCHVMWKNCHKQVHLQVDTVETGKTSFSQVIHAHDSLSFNPDIQKDQVIILINDIIQN